MIGYLSNDGNSGILHYTKIREPIKNGLRPAWQSKGMRGDMSACSFKKLVQLLDKQLEIDEKLEVLAHLESCGICRDAVYQISHDRDEKLFIHKPYNVEKHIA
jgi:hypothetical protein